MKRKLLYISLAVLGISSLSAQTVTLIDRNFDAPAQFNDCYGIDADGDGFNWVSTNSLADSEEVNMFGGLFYSASFNQETQTALTPDNLLALPVVTIPEGATDVKGFVKIGALDFTEFAEHFAVYVVSGDAQTTELISFAADGIAEPSEVVDILGFPLMEQTLPTYFATEKVVNLDAYAGQTIRLVVRHFDCTDEYFIGVDGYRVTATTLGVNDYASSLVKVYPNPASSVLHINLDQSTTATSYKLFDLHGRNVGNGNFNGFEASADVSSLASGMYVLEVETSEGRATKKFVKN